MVRENVLFVCPLLVAELCAERLLLKLAQERPIREQIVAEQRVPHLEGIGCEDDRPTQFVVVVPVDLLPEEREQPDKLPHGARVGWQQWNDLTKGRFRNVRAIFFCICESHFHKTGGGGRWKPSGVVDDFFEEFEPITEPWVVAAQNLTYHDWVKCADEGELRCVHQFFEGKQYLWHELGRSSIQIINEDDNSSVSEFLAQGWQIGFTESE